MNYHFFFIDLVAQRGEKLELLIDKTENLVDSVSLTFFQFYVEQGLYSDIKEKTL